MFRTTKKEKQLGLFSSVSEHFKGASYKQYTDEGSWHNVFREQVMERIDENMFRGLFDEKMGAPNASVKVQIAMMILKEAFGWSDARLYEESRFNLLVRRALGMYNLDDEVPVSSTYYLLRKRIYEYGRMTGENLLEKTFAKVTQEQIKEFSINGEMIRLDSKLLGSNIAFFTRYEIVHQTLLMFYKKLSKQDKEKLPGGVLIQLEEMLKEEPEKTVYRSTREEIRKRLQELGNIIYPIIELLAGSTSDLYSLLERVFREQYKVIEQRVELRPKEEIDSGSVQSPHDPGSGYRNKDNKPIKGYSVNITETAGDQPLNLITNVQVEKANVPDTIFVNPAIDATEDVTGQEVKKVYADGAYQSPENDQICEGIDMVYTGIQGFASRYDLEMTTDGLLVTDTITGEQHKGILAKKNKLSKEDKWRISTSEGAKYFSQQAIRASELRRQLKQRPLSELHKRNNVEATIFQLSYTLRNNKTKYRGKFKQEIWALCRCLWINLVRIVNYIGQFMHPRLINVCKMSFSRLFCQISLFFKPYIPIFAP